MAHVNFADDGQAPFDEDEGVVETDPTGRFSRYDEAVGQGTFKRVFKAFDKHRGVDVAWNRIGCEDLGLTDEEFERVLAEVGQGRLLSHRNVIKCYRCWADKDTKTVNYITELFTSGNLREYRKRHKSLELKSIAKFGLQLLEGLKYLHERQNLINADGTPVLKETIVHGDLRCDKVYVNGHRGEIKIGDLGLATLLPRRYACDSNHKQSVQCAEIKSEENSADPRVDIFAFGLLMLELVTRQTHQPGCEHPEGGWSHVVDGMQITCPGSDADNAAKLKSLLQLCLGQLDLRPTAGELIQHPFFQLAKETGPRRKTTTDFGDREASVHGASSANLALLDWQMQQAAQSQDDQEISFSKGELDGIAFRFTFKAEMDVDGKYKLDLLVQRLPDAVADLSTQGLPQKKRFRFPFDPRLDTAQGVTGELVSALAEQNMFLESVDQELCEAALQETLKELESKQN